MVSGDRIFDAAFAAASNSQPLKVAGVPYAGEYAFAEALRLTSEILAGVLSVCPERQRNARRRLEQLLTSGKEIS
ncbi:hypothetical protein AB6Q56_08375 [Dechloromonas sp. ARDL1]|uniref:hypothetical protein n=1 Tax=Dechloromonas sp. ARDL1 TaxID=3322121 RepID=UPI003DA6E378